MNILAFDTALESCSVAIQTASGEILCDHRQQDRGHAETLVPQIVDLMKQAGLSFHDLNLLATTTGPGSFTGLRTGLSAAQGYALSLGLPLIGITTLEMLAHEVPTPQDRRILSLIDSKRGDFYYQIFDDQAVALTQPDIVRPENLSQRIQEKRVVLVGNGAAAAAPLLAHSDVEIYHTPVDARALLPIAQARYQKGGTGHPCECKPLYLRDADAQPPRENRIAVVS